MATDRYSKELGETIRGDFSKISLRDDRNAIRLQIDKCRQGDLLIVRVEARLKPEQRRQIAAAVKGQLADGSGVSVLVLDEGSAATLVQGRDWATSIDSKGNAQAVDIKDRDRDLTTRFALDEAEPLFTSERKAEIIEQIPTRYRGLLPIAAKIEDVSKMATSLVCSQCRSSHGVGLVSVPNDSGERVGRYLCLDCFAGNPAARPIVDGPHQFTDRQLATARRYGDGVEVVHACPAEDDGAFPCCGRMPFEVPRNHRMTSYPELVTCGGVEAQLTPVIVPGAVTVGLRNSWGDWEPESCPPITDEIARQPVIDGSCLEQPAGSWRDRESLL